MKFIYKLFTLFLILFIQVAHADNINNIRTYANTDKTRVVIDTDFNPHYSTALNNDGKSFVIRINDVTNYKGAIDNISFDKNSAIKGIVKDLDGNDVRYIFSLQGSSVPNIFVLKPQGNVNYYRLVIDFPHTSTKSVKSSQKINVISQSMAKKLEGTGVGAGGVPPVNVITIKDADNAENELLNSLSTVGSDGIRTMTPSQVQEYQDKLKQMAKSNDKDNTQEEVVLDTQAPPPPQEVLAQAYPFIIAVDAGHGGKDPGAIGKRGVREKNVTLSIALYLAQYIDSNPQFRARLIRSKDVFVDLNKRSQIARAYKADILISIHADSVASGSQARGASVWVLSNNRAQRENNKLLKSTEQSNMLLGAGDVISQSDNPYLAATILDMTSDSSRNAGYALGTEILDNLGAFTKLHKNKPIYASLAVLKSPDIPSLLIETGFLSNQYEEIKLNQPNYQKQIAYRIYKGIEAYYKKYPAQMFKSRQENAKRVGSPEKIYTVKKGDSLSKIAKAHNVSVKAIKNRNKLMKNTISIGQKLVIPH